MLYKTNVKLVKW